MGRKGKSGIKPIVGWIKTGGGNNREIIERVEKQKKDHFWHKAHKKPRKKTKEKGQYSIFHNEANIFTWFYIPKEQLVLSSEGTPLSILLARIKVLYCSVVNLLVIE